MYPSAGGTGVLWWLYADHRKALDNATTTVFGKEVVADNVKALLIYAIISTVFTVRPQGSPAPGRTAPSGEIQRWRYIGVGMSYPAVSASVSVPAPHPSPHATAAQMLKAWVTRCLSKNRILGWVYRPRPHKADFMAKPQRSCTVRPSVYTKPANPLTETVIF